MLLFLPKNINPFQPDRGDSLVSGFKIEYYSE
jgi:hypothetical protein